jgi:hypothetical protein
MKKLILIICLSVLILSTGCRKKPKLTRIKDIPKDAKEVSVWDCDGIDENNMLVDTKKVKVNKNSNHISQVLNALCEIEDGEEYVTPCANLLCFTTDEGIFCVDIEFFGDHIYGYGYMDKERKLEKALEEAGLMPVPYEPNLP